MTLKGVACVDRRDAIRESTNSKGRAVTDARAVENCVVIKAGSETPMSLEVLMLPRGVLNMAFGHCSEISTPPARGPSDCDDCL